MSARHFLSFITALFVCFNANAQISFQKVYAGFEHNAPSQVIETPDGYLISGDGDSWISGRRHGLLLMIDHQGQVLWQKQYGEHLQAVTFYDVAATNNGFIVVGTMHSNYIDKKLYIVQTDNQGNEIWSKMIDGPQTMWPNTVMAIPGGCIISGHNGLFMNQT